MTVRWTVRAARDRSQILRREFDKTMWWGSHLRNQNKKQMHHLCILSGENANTTKEFSLVVFFSAGNSLPKPPLCKGRWLAEQDGGIVNLQSKNNPSVTYGDSSLCTREPYMHHSFAYSGFGLLPDFARWTSTRYACPGRKRRESG